MDIKKAVIIIGCFLVIGASAIFAINNWSFEGFGSTFGANVDNVGDVLTTSIEGVSQTAAVSNIVTNCPSGQVCVDGASPRQTIDAFGVGAVTVDSFLFNSSTKDDNVVFDLLFDQVKGAGFSGVRNEITGDNHDANRLPWINSHLPTEGGSWYWDGDRHQVAFMQGAKARGVNVFLSTVWSPPPWMKNNNSYLGTGDSHLRTDKYQAFADYLAEYALKYKTVHNIDITNIAFANEPGFPSPYQGALWTTSEAVNFLNNYLKPTFVNRGVTAKITGADYEGWNYAGFVDALISQASNSVDVISQHGYGDNILTPTATGYQGNLNTYQNVKNANKRLWLTEISSIAGLDNLDGDYLNWAKHVHDYMVIPEINAWFHWVAITADNQFPWNQKLMNANSAGDTPQVSKELYSIAHFSKFIRPGYVRVENSNTIPGVFVSAYKDPNNSSKFAVVVINQNSSEKNLIYSLSSLGSTSSVRPYLTDANRNLTLERPVSVSSNTFTYNIPARSIVTFVPSAIHPSTPITSGYLSDMKWSSMSTPVGMQGSYYVGVNMGMADRLGLTLSINGTNYSKGFSATAPFEAVFYLGGQCTSFTSDIGAAAGKDAQGTFEVYGDGNLINSVTVPVNQKGTISATLNGYQELKIVTKKSGGTEDQIAWGNPQVTCGVVTPGVPTTSITSPTGGTITIPAGESSISIPISATALDTDGTISKVEFYNGGTKLGEDTQAPYTFQWNSVTQGSYTLTTKATDNAGNIGTSAPVSVSVQVAAIPNPTVSISASPSTITAGQSSTITWSSTNTVGSTPCTASGGWTGTKAASGSQSVSPTTSTTYTITCTGEAGTSPAVGSTSVGISVGSGNGTGLTGEYFNNKTLTAPSVLTRTDSILDFYWGSGSPGSGVNVDDFSIRWTGKVEPRFSETYTFTVTGDDGIRLWVNGQQLANGWVDQGPTSYSGQIALVAGQQYDIKVEYYENAGGTTAKLEWQSPSQSRQVISASQLYPSTITPPQTLTVSLTSPANGTTVTVGSPVTVTAQVTDGGASATRSSFIARFWNSFTQPFRTIGDAVGSTVVFFFGGSTDVNTDSIAEVSPRSQLAAVGAPTSVTYTLPNTSASYKTSAGIYRKSDGVLVKTLWSNVQKSQGQQSLSWDGTDDAGTQTPGSVSDYEAKVLYHNVNYQWEGVIGNTSQSFEGWNLWDGYQVSDMVVIGNTAYITHGYNELGNPWWKFDVANPQSRTPSMSLNPYSNIAMYDRSFLYMATDGSRIYYANVGNYFDQRGFVVARNVSDLTGHTFSSGVEITGNNPFPSAIDLVAGEGVITGIAVQSGSGTNLLVSHNTGDIKVFHKTTGALIKTIPISSLGAGLSSPKRITSDPSGDLWVIAKENGQPVVIKITNISGTPSIGVKITGLSDPRAIAVNPSGLLAVVDAGTSQQVKSYDANGTAQWSLGLPGGYNIANGPGVTNTKFSFDGDSFIAFQSDGSFWVGDAGNSRYLQFSANRTYIKQFAYLSNIYRIAVASHDPTRVFAGFLEYQVDYSKPLTPGDPVINNGAWRLVRNWTSERTVPFENGFGSGFADVFRLSNGRTYARVKNMTIDHIFNIVELPASGPLRVTKTTLPNTGYVPQLDGSISFSNNETDPGNSTFSIYKTTLPTFDGDGDPVWNVIGAPLLASVPKSSDSPYYQGHFPEGRFPITSSGKVISLSGKVIHGGMHLGAINTGSNSGWLWQASPSGRFTCGSNEYGDPCSPNVSGDVINPDGTFDTSPNISYAGNLVRTVGDNIIYGYHGEFWNSGQANQWLHFYDNGLFVGQFGKPAYSQPTYIPERHVNNPGQAGNSFSWFLTNVNGVDYMWNGDESVHGGIHRWKINGLNSINVMTVPFGPVTPGTPTTSITSPTGGQSFTAPASISISATAADTDGTITKVEFYNGGTKLGEDTTSPYNFTWSSVPAGSYSLTTKATDNAGNIGTSAPVSVSVQPGAVASYKVEFFAGTTKIGEDIDDNLLSPFGGIWTPTVAGTYVITAKATRMSDGIVANSSPVNITVNTSVGTSDPTKGDFKIYRLSSTDAVLPVSFGADLVFDGATTTENPAIYNNVLASVYTSTTSQPNFHYMKVRNIPGYQVGRSVCSYTRGSSECLVPTSYSKINCSDGWCLDQAGVSPNTVTKIAYRYIPGAPIVTLTATPTTVSPGQSTTLTWSVTGTTKTNPCTAYDGWTGKKAASGTQVITGLTSTRKFKLVCSGGSGYGEANVIVNVVVQTNQPPTALIRYTGPSGSVYRGDVLPFNITATDSDGSISKVEFYVDDQLTSTDTSAPYDFSWTVPMTPYVSTHTFYGVSYDNLGERTQSNVAQGNISTLRDSSPIVKISPTTSQAAPASYTVTVINDYLPGEEVETGFKVNKIEFVRNGTVINTDTTYPYEFVDSNVPAGSYSYVARMTATVEGQTYDENSNTVSATVTGSTPPDTSVSGLKGEYFNNTSWSGTPVVTKVDSNVNFNWGGDAPTAGVNADEFSVRWTGKVIPRYSEPYEFHLAGDDGASLSINGQAVSGWWTPVTMVAGQEYSIEVKHYENFGGASVTLEWKSPSQAREVIPSSQFKTSPLARLTDDTLVAAVANATEPVVRGIAIASVVVLLGVGVALISKKRHQ